MATAKITDPKTKEEIQFYMEERLKHGIDNKILPSLHKKDKDFIICVDGREGCSPKGTKVMMSNGSFKNIEDIKIGDEIISPQTDGTNKFSKIIKLFKFKSENIYDVHELNRQNKILYSCSGNHWIPINKKNEKKKKWDVVHYQAKDLINKSQRFIKNSTTPTSFAIEKFKNKENCEIEPYTLGVWLGDGHFSSKKTKKINPKYEKETIVKSHLRYFSSGKVCFQREHKANHNKNKFLNFMHRDIGITCNDFEIIEEVSKFYPIMNVYSKEKTDAKTYRFSLNGELSKVLVKYGLEGKGSGDKFIPKEALTSDIEYRKKLLAGLIDTDGTLSKSCSYSITSKSEKLIKDIEFLIYSLGGRASIRKIKKGIKKTGFVGEYFRISFYIGNLKLPIKIKRKIKKNNCFYLSANRTSIKLKKREGEMVYGFTVNSQSHWYITNNFTITRNSGKSTLAIQMGKYIDPTLNLNRIVFSPEDFREAILKAKKGQCIIYDEAFTGFSSRASLSPVNRVLVSLAMQMRQKNLAIIIVLPTIFLLDRYMAIFRTRSLIHVYESKGRRGYFAVYNYKSKKRLILLGAKTMSYYGKIARPNFKGRFYGKFGLGEGGIEQEYRKKKDKALRDSEKTSMTSAQVKFKEQRDLLMWLFRNYTGIKLREIAVLLDDYGFSISFEQISKICSKFGEISPEKIKEHLESGKKEVKTPEKELKTPKKDDLQDKKGILKGSD